jgi:hypothetical protein
VNGLTVERLREVDTARVGRLAGALRERAERTAALHAAAEDASVHLAGWQGPAAAASTARRRMLADDAGRIGDAQRQAARAVTELADQLDQAHQLLALADSFADQVGCRIHHRAEITALPPDRLGPLSAVYDSVRRTAATLADQALVLAEAADLRATRTLATTTLDDHPTEPSTASRTTAVGTAEPVGAVGGRYARSRMAMEGCRERLRATRDRLRAEPPEQRTVRRMRTLDAVNQRIGTINAFLASRTARGIDPATGLVRTERRRRRFLDFDPSGPGQVVEVLGADLTTARQVAVLVPGGRNDLETFNPLAVDARLLADTAGPDTAVVAWLGYDSAACDTGSTSRARTGATALRRFLTLLTNLTTPPAPAGPAGMAGPAGPTGPVGMAGPAGMAVPAGPAGMVGDSGPASRPARLVVVGHGFGSVLVAAALRAGARADDVVFVGSPGLGRQVRAATHLRPAQPGTAGGPGPAGPAGLPGWAPGDGVRCWVLRAPGDTVAYSRLHGADPAEFADVTRLETQGGAEVLGHDRYYAVGSESLDNLARVAAGRFDEITTTDSTIPDELAIAGLAAADLPDLAELTRLAELAGYHGPADAGVTQTVLDAVAGLAGLGGTPEAGG